MSSSLPTEVFIQRKRNERRFISASFLESDWLNEIQVAENVLFIAAGVFYYFEEDEVKEFLVRLADSFPGSEIVFDMSSPFGIKLANRMVITNSGLDKKSFLKWGLESTESISAWDKRFRILNTYYYFGQKARSLKLKTRLLGFISDFLKLQYMVHLEMMERSLDRRGAR